MSVTATLTIPFETQSDPRTRRDCGAACLSMVYRSLGKEVPRAEIWQAIAGENRFGSLSSMTHLMVHDTLARGLDAVALQARHPLQALRVCREAGVHAILNFRPTTDSATGHYAVLVDIGEREVVLHDPYYGPSRRLTHPELLELWQPRLPDSEIVGYLLIAVGARPATATSPCWLCHTPMPSMVGCPRCKQPVCLQPGAVLGCVNNDCIARMWNWICCSSCDYAFTFSVDAQALAMAAPPVPEADAGKASAAAEQSAAPASTKGSLDLSRVLRELDKFCSLLLSVPGVADHPDIKKQLNFIASNKEKLKLAQVEALVHRKAHQEQLASLVQTSKQNDEGHRKKLEEVSRRSSPLDANALGHALLRNLGFIGGTSHQPSQ